MRVETVRHTISIIESTTPDHFCQYRKIVENLLAYVHEADMPELYSALDLWKRKNDAHAGGRRCNTVMPTTRKSVKCRHNVPAMH